MADPSSRMLRLLGLLQVHREWPGPELADRLGVTSRTVRRDVDRLRQLGYPIHAVAGAAGYTLGAGQQMPPLLLDDDEAVAVTVALSTAGSSIGETAARALANLEQVLPSRLRYRAAAVRAAVVAMPAAAPEVSTENLWSIASAINRHERLRFDYADRRNQRSRREVEAYQLVYGGRRWYLLAWDPGPQDWRTFRVDRMTVKTPGGARFAPRPLPEDGAGWTSRQVSTSGYRYQGRFTVHAPADAVTERIGPAAASVEPINGDRCLLLAGSESLDDLALSITRLGFDFDVHSPAELVHAAHRLGSRLGRVRHLHDETEAAVLSTTPVDAAADDQVQLPATLPAEPTSEVSW